MEKQELEYKMHKAERELDYYESELSNLKGLRDTLSPAIYEEERKSLETYIERIKKQQEEYQKQLKSIKETSDLDTKQDIQMGINDYKEEISRNRQELTHLNQELSSLYSAEKDMGREEFQREVESISKHIEKVQETLNQNISTVNAYNSMRNNIIQLRNLNDIETYNKKEKQEIEEECTRRQEEIETSKASLSAFLQKELVEDLIENGIITKTEEKEEVSVNKLLEDNFDLDSITQEEFKRLYHQAALEYQNDEEILKRLNELNVKMKEKQKNKEQTPSITIEYYYSKRDEEQLEIDHLTKEIENLLKVKNDMNFEAYNKEMNQIQEYMAKEVEKLEKTNQIIYEYEKMQENLKGLEKLDSLTARDYQDKEEMNEERRKRESEIEYSKSILPKELVESVLNPKKENLENMIEGHEIETKKEEPLGLPDNIIKPTLTIQPQEVKKEEPAKETEEPEQEIPKIEEKPVQQEEKEVDKVKKQEVMSLRKILGELTEGLEIKKTDTKQYKRYTTSNIRVSKSFKQQLSAGNYIYNIAHFPMAVVTSAITPVTKIINKLLTKKDEIDRIKKIEERIQNLSEEKLEFIMENYSGNKMRSDKDLRIVQVLLNKRIQSHIDNKVTNTNQQLEEQYNKAFMTITKLDALDEELNKQDLKEAERQALLEKRAQTIAGSATLIQSIRENQKTVDKLLEGTGALSFAQNLKAAVSKMSEVGNRFAKNSDMDKELLEKEIELEVKEKEAVRDGNDEDALRAFVEFEKLQSQNTKIENSVFGKRSVGQRYYQPLGERLDYRDDPLVKDIFTGIAMITAGISAANAIKTHLVDDPKLLLQEQERIEAINSANSQTIEQVQQAGDSITAKSEAFSEGMVAQANDNLVNTAHTLERQALDQSGWRPSGSTYKTLDAANHELYNTAYNQAELELQEVATKLADGSINQTEALEMIGNISNQTQNTLTTVFEEYIPIMEEYAKNNPQFDLTAALEGMKHIANNPDAISNMNNAMVDVIKTGEQLSGLTFEQVTALNSLPSDLQTTLLSSVTTVALVSKVCSNMVEKGKQGRYGNNVTNLVSAYVEFLEDDMEEEEELENVDEYTEDEEANKSL